MTSSQPFPSNLCIMLSISFKSPMRKPQTFPLRCTCVISRSHVRRSLVFDSKAFARVIPYYLALPLNMWANWITFNCGQSPGNCYYWHEWGKDFACGTTYELREGIWTCSALATTSSWTTCPHIPLLFQCTRRISRWYRLWWLERSGRDYWRGLSTSSATWLNDKTDCLVWECIYWKCKACPTDVESRAVGLMAWHSIMAAITYNNAEKYFHFR